MHHEINRTENSSVWVGFVTATVIQNVSCPPNHLVGAVEESHVLEGVACDLYLSLCHYPYHPLLVVG